MRRQQWEWGWYCAQDDALSRLLGLVVVGWAPALLLIVWQGGILPTLIYVLTQVRTQGTERDREDWTGLGAWK